MENRKIISQALSEKMDIIQKEEKISTIIWLKGPNTSQLLEPLEQERDQVSERLISRKAKAMRASEEPEEEAKELLAERQLLREIKVRKKLMLKEAFTSYNSHFVSSDMQSMEIFYQSSYLPVVLAKLTKSEIASLSSKPCIESIDILGDEPVSPCSASAVASNLNTVLANMGADYVLTTLKLTGNGINIGQIENSVPSNGKATIVTNPVCPSSNDHIDHANLVASCIKAAAPNAALYATAISKPSTFIPGVEALMNNLYLDLLNCSFSIQSNGVYNNSSKTVDYLTTLYDMVIVFAVGNDDEKMVNDYAIAYNAVAVGGYTQGNTSAQTDDTFAYTDHTQAPYAYLQGTKYDRNTPDVMAPGVGISDGVITKSGSSFAAPLVAGALAALGEYEYQVAWKPSLAKAIALVSCVNKLPDDSTWGKYNLEDNPAMSYRQGAGKFNAKIAAQVLQSGQWKTYRKAGAGFTVSIPLDITTPNVIVRVALAWKHVEESSSGTAMSSKLSDFDLRLVYPNGRNGKLSGNVCNNVELIEYNVKSQTGAYTITIRNTRDEEAYNTDIAVAWWFE